jgi:Uma2 family endonuclease
MTAMPVRKIFTVREYNQMIDAGVFIGNSNYELINGEIVSKIRKAQLCNGCINRLSALLVQQLSEKAILSVRNAVSIGEISEPEPDVSILKYREDFYETAKATEKDVLLLIEVSDSTMSYDRRVKIAMYAQANIPEVWLVNLSRKIVEVYTQPEDGKYKVVGKLGKSHLITPKLLPELTVKISDIIK